MYTLGQHWEILRLTEDVDFGKKSSFQMKLILILAGMKTSKIVAFGAQKTGTNTKLVTVWCGFWSRGLIGPFCIENEQADAVTVNGDRYRAVLNEFLFTKIEEQDNGNIWFQQDDTTCHTAEVTLDV